MRCSNNLLAAIENGANSQCFDLYALCGCMLEASEKPSQVSGMKQSGAAVSTYLYLSVVCSTCVAGPCGDEAPPRRSP